MGETQETPTQRGLLELQFPDGVPSGKSSKFTNSSDYISTFAQEIESTLAIVSQGATAIQFSRTPSLGLTAHSDFTNFLNETLVTTDRITFAMQSLITILAGSLYYEELPNFNNNTFVQQTNFLQAQIPGGRGAEYQSTPAGFQRGCIAFLALTLMHIFLISNIILWFLTGKSLTSLLYIERLKKILILHRNQNLNTRQCLADHRTDLRSSNRGLYLQSISSFRF
jgi:hypothetical protein